MLPKQIGKLLIEFEIDAATVSHWSSERRSFKIDFSIDELISLFFFHFAMHTVAANWANFEIHIDIFVKLRAQIHKA